MSSRSEVRSYDALLTPAGGEQALGDSSAIESSVMLATFGTSWAAAYRAGEQGLERIRVRTPYAGWVTPAALPGPEGDRPALVALDSSHLLLVFTIGSDPLATGSASIGRLALRPIPWVDLPALAAER